MLTNQTPLQEHLLNVYYYTSDGMLRSCKNDKAVSCALIVMDGQKLHIKKHRAIFAMHHGYLPEIVDHINRNTADNRIENLRPATASMNNCNKVISPTNTSGYAGVDSVFREGRIQYTAHIHIDGIRTRIGTYPTAAEAFDAYYDALVQKAGQYAPAKEMLMADWVK